MPDYSKTLVARAMKAGAVPLVVLLMALPWHSAKGSDTQTSVQPLPTIEDPAGDSNGIDELQPQGPDTRPASIDSLDIRRLSLETIYTVETTKDPETGKIVLVRHVPQALRLTMETSAPVKPPPAFLLLGSQYSIQFQLDTNCWFELGLLLRGSLSSAQSQDWPFVRFLGCPGGNRIVDPLPVSFSGNLTLVDIPFAATGGILARSVRLGPRGREPHSGLQGFGRTWDRTIPIPEFTVGSDIPADVDCRVTPGDPACA